MKQSRSFEELMKRVRESGIRLRELSTETSRGKLSLVCYRYKRDLFLIPQVGIAYRRARRYPVVLIKKKDLEIGKDGYLFAYCEGNYSTLLTPLFTGRFGKELCHVSATKRDAVLAHRVVYANRTQGGVEIVQRETDFELLLQADQWFQSHQFQLNECIFFERTEAILKYAEENGILWRVRPRVFSQEEKKITVNHAWQQAESVAHYYVSVRGVHWLSFEEFERVASFALHHPEILFDCLKEWVGVPIGKALCAMCRPKANRHAIEILGVPRADAEIYLIEPLMKIYGAMKRKAMRPQDVADAFTALSRIFYRLLKDKDFARLSSATMVDVLYDIIMDDDTKQTPEEIDFDNRRIAVPGVSFKDGQIIQHPGIDELTLRIVGHLVDRLSFNEKAMSINVFVVRSSKTLTSETARSREIVIKTNRTPVPISYIQKKLGSVRVGYADYTLARANIFRTLGADLPILEVLTVTGNYSSREETPYFLRTRCPGDPLSAIPEEWFKINVHNKNGAEDPDVVRALAQLYGSAAADNLIAKKFLPSEGICRFGKGKEIFEFVYDPFKRRLMPTRVQTCSIRGTMGWPNFEKIEDNLNEAHRFYLNAFAKELASYWRKHADACTLNECANAFFDGFMRKIEAMHWTYQQNKSSFDTFDPGLRPGYYFREKLDFALWSLVEAEKRLLKLREDFLDAVRANLIRV